MKKNKKEIQKKQKEDAGIQPTILHWKAKAMDHMQPRGSDRIVLLFTS